MCVSTLNKPTSVRIRLSTLLIAPVRGASSKADTVERNLLIIPKKSQRGFVVGARIKAGGPTWPESGWTVMIINTKKTC